MKKLAIVFLLVVVGCHRQVRVTSAPSATTATNATGAATAREAVQLFLAAGRAQDIQALTAVWGSSGGSIRDTRAMEEVEQRAIIVLRCLRHDSYSILSENVAAGGERVFNVEVRRGTLTPKANFTSTPGPQNRWYLREFQFEALNPICTSK